MSVVAGGMESVQKRLEERDRLRHVVAQWNANRLDLFELSEPDDNLQFHGVMRFYYQDAGQKVATKCIRVTSSATAQDIVAILIEKFRPDMRMLSTPRFALYEIHESGEERALELHERPLYVQLNWHQDDLEGRFLLRNLDESHEVLRNNMNTSNGEGVFKRKLSRREKKEIKKQEKVRKMQLSTENDSSVAEKLYTELPETSFTRSISNPEAVMRRRRQQKLEKKLQQFRSRDGGPDTGGTLKIYGESLCSDVPYKTLLLSVGDTASSVVVEMLHKYGMFREDPCQYCLVQMVTQEPQVESNEYHAPVGPYKEYVLDDGECPLSILMNHAATRGSIMFHVRRRPIDQQSRKRKKKPATSSCSVSDVDHGYRGNDHSSLPFLLEVNADGSDVTRHVAHRIVLQQNVTQVGSDAHLSESTAAAGQQCVRLTGEQVAPRHCVFTHAEHGVTITPCSPHTDSYVNGKRVLETTVLQHGCMVQLGRSHRFRFLDPSHEETLMRLAHHNTDLHHSHNYQQQQQTRHSLAVSVEATSGEPVAATDVETTFDVDGHVETNHSATILDSSEPQYRVNLRSGNYASYPRAGCDPILPAVLEFREETEDDFLRAVISRLDPSCLQFKLAPTYTLYMAARFRASTHYRSELSPAERALKLTDMLTRVASMIHDAVQSRRSDANALAFWMANSSEYLHFLKQDRHISAYSREAQDILADCVQTSFWYLVELVQKELSDCIGHFLEDRDDANEDEGSTAGVLSVLGNTMALLRRCRVNAALTIQLFSQLFHFINMGVFNSIVNASSPVNYCSRLWGVRLKRRLNRVEEWADKLGLELAADCHLARVVQASHLLTAPKNNVDDLTTISSTCYKLNSLQLRALLQSYEPAADEPSIPPELIDNIVRISESTSDELAKQDGRSISVQESLQLHLPFLLPEDGYSCDIVRGIPNGLSEFIAPLQHAGMARMSEQPSSWGYWTIYMTEQDLSHTQPRCASSQSMRSGTVSSAASRAVVSSTCPVSRPALIDPAATTAAAADRPEVHVICIQKSNTGMGLSIVAAKGSGQERLGIYIKSVVAGGAADADGRLAAGDQLVSVDEHSLIDISQEEAAEYMMKTGRVVTLRVAKQAAVFHGLTTLLSQPSPVSSRGVRHPREDLLIQQGRIQGSKSVPVLNAGGAVHGGTLPPSAAAVAAQMGPTARHLNEAHNPAFNISASNTSLVVPAHATTMPAVAGGGEHLRSRSVQNLGAGGGMMSPPRVTPSLTPQQHRAQLQQQQTPHCQPVHAQSPVIMSPSSRHYAPAHHAQYQHPALLAGTSTLPNMAHRSPHKHLPQSAVTGVGNIGGGGGGGGMVRSVSEQEHLRYRPAAISSHNNLLPVHDGSFNQQQHLIEEMETADSPPAPARPPPPARDIYATSPLHHQHVNAVGSHHWQMRQNDEVARRYRDQQIAHLQCLPQLSQQQQQQLDTLRLEKRFQERMDLAATDDPHVDTSETAGSQEMREHNNNTINGETVHHKERGMAGGGVARDRPQHPLPVVTSSAPAGTDVENRAALVRRQQQQEMRRKQAEFEAAHQAEQRLLREAHRRRQQQQQQQAGDCAVSGARRLDSLLLQQQTLSPVPVPPERGASFSVMAQQRQMTAPGKPEVSVAAVVSTKRVQFHEPAVTTASLNHDVDPACSSASSSCSSHAAMVDQLTSSVSEAVISPSQQQQQQQQQQQHDQSAPLNTVSTPGVIGAQEVYRDPRTRRLAHMEGLQRAATSSQPIPEHLSFREKMKMFASESGQLNTPKSKVKTSSKQRQIELGDHQDNN